MKHRQKSALVLALGSVLLWSTVATAFKLTLRYMSVTELVWWASLVSFLVLSLIVLASGKMALLRTHVRRRWRETLFLGVMNPLVYYLALFRAYELLPAQEAQAINYTWALVLMFLSVPMLGHRLNGSDLLAAALGYLGVLIIATHGDLFGLAFESLLGVGLALLSTLFWALYWMMTTRIPEETVVVLAANFGVGVLGMGLYMVWQGIPMALPSLAGGVGAVYIGLFEMSVTFVMWGGALRRAEKTASISNLIFLSPLLSLGLIHVVLGEAILPSTVVALGLILSGLLIQHRYII